MKRIISFLIILLFCSLGFARIQKYDQNGEWTDEYFEYRKKQSFTEAWAREEGFSFIIDSSKYGLTFFPFNSQTFFNKSEFSQVKTIPKMEIKIIDENDNIITWQYENYLRRYFNLEKLLFDFPSVIYSDINSSYDYLGDRWFKSYDFCVSVINRNDKIYFVTLLNYSIGVLYECNFETATLELIKEQVIPPCIIRTIDVNNKLTQEEGVIKIIDLILTIDFEVEMEARTLNNNDYKNLLNIDKGGMILNSDSEITTTSFLTEGATTYNIENAKTIEGLPFVPATGETYSNVITLKTDTPNNRGFVIQNGYISKERPDLYGKNCRVKTLKVIYPNIESPFEQIVTLKDDTSLQFVPFMWNLLDDCKEVQIVIDSVYQGTKYDDVCINYIGLVTQTPVEISER